MADETDNENLNPETTQPQKGVGDYLIGAFRKVKGATKGVVGDLREDLSGENVRKTFGVNVPRNNSANTTTTGIASGKAGGGAPQTPKAPRVKSEALQNQQDRDALRLIVMRNSKYATPQHTMDLVGVLQRDMTVGDTPRQPSARKVNISTERGEDILNDTTDTHTRKARVSGERGDSMLSTDDHQFQLQSQKNANSARLAEMELLLGAYQTSRSVGEKLAGWGGKEHVDNLRLLAYGQELQQ